MAVDLRGAYGWRWRVAAALLLALGSARAASADFHLVLVVEVFVGAEAAPDAQYVVLQMYAPGQTNLSGHPMRFFNAAGASLGTSAFGTIANGADDARILIATATAEALFGISADLRVPARRPAAGGKVCFETIDCFAWGSFSALPDATVGTPFSDFAPDLAARRTVAGSLDAGDDSDDSAADFAAVTNPAPRNNAGGVGALAAAALLLDGFEDAGLDGWSSAVQ